MALTYRGWRVAALSLVVIAFSLLYWDLLLGILSIIILFTLLYEHINVWWTGRDISGVLKFENEVTLTMVAGGSEHVEVSAESTSRLNMEIGSPFKWCEIKPKLLKKQKMTLSYIFSPVLAGEYEVDSLPIQLLSRWSLINLDVSHLFGVSVKVYPRVLVAIMRTAEFLTRGVQGVGDVPIELKGGGLEYAESREYVQGDDTRRFDWKASARLAKLMVKDYYLDAGSTVHLIFDTRVSDPVSRDELLTSFLNNALGIAQLRIPFGLTVHNGEDIFVHIKPGNANETLQSALQYVLSSVEVDLEEIDVLLESRSLFEVKALLAKFKQEPILQALTVELEALLGGIKTPYRLVRQFILDSSNAIQVVVVSELVGDVPALIDLSRIVSAREGTLIVLQPCEPWLRVENLETAYEWYENYGRISKVLASNGVKVSKSLLLASQFPLRNKLV